MQLEIPSALSLKQVPCKVSASAYTASCFSAKLCLSYLDHACYNLLILLCFHSNRFDRFRRPSNASRRSRMQHSNQITALVCAHVHGNALIQSHWWSLLCKSTLSSACRRMQAYTHLKSSECLRNMHVTNQHPRSYFSNSCFLGNLYFDWGNELQNARITWQALRICDQLNA